MPLNFGSIGLREPPVLTVGHNPGFAVKTFSTRLDIDGEPSDHSEAADQISTSQRFLSSEDDVALVAPGYDPPASVTNGEWPITAAESATTEVSSAPVVVDETEPKAESRPSSGPLPVSKSATQAA